MPFRNTVHHPYLVVSGINQNLVYYLEEARDIFDVTIHHTLGIRVVDPHRLDNGLYTTNVGVGAFEDVFQLCELMGAKWAATDAYSQQRTLVYVSEALLFFPFAAALAFGAEVGASESAPSMSKASESALSLMSTRTGFFFVAAADLDFAGALAAFTGLAVAFVAGLADFAYNMATVS